MAAIPPVCDFNQDARAFKLKGVDEKIYDLFSTLRSILYANKSWRGYLGRKL